MLIDRCRQMVAARSRQNTGSSGLVQGIALFLDQLVTALRHEQLPAPLSDTASTTEVADIAALHGRDLLEQGFTIEHVVRDYGDVCQAVTSLALETGTPITVGEFRTFNRCLDNAIAGAVTEYARRGAQSEELGREELKSRLGHLAHELRNYVHTATLVVDAIKAGNVGISGATGAVLDRSLLGMRSLIDGALAEVRVTARLPLRRESIPLAKFLTNVKRSASFEALARGTAFTMLPVADDISIYADPEMLAAAVGNLLQNAFKFTKHRTEVRLHAYAEAGRVLIDVEDRCGGLPTGTAEMMFLPFAQNGEDRSGLGLGLDIARRSVEANGGALRVRDVPGTGCIFTIDLPRLTTTSSAATASSAAASSTAASSAPTG